jgi:hypothetical protein
MSRKVMIPQTFYAFLGGIIVASALLGPAAFSHIPQVTTLTDPDPKEVRLTVLIPSRWRGWSCSNDVGWPKNSGNLNNKPEASFSVICLRNNGYQYHDKEKPLKYPFVGGGLSPNI